MAETQSSGATRAKWASNLKKARFFIFLGLLSFTFFVVLVAQLKLKPFGDGSDLATRPWTEQTQDMSWDPHREHSGQKTGASKGAWLQQTLDRNGRTTKEAVLIKDGEQLVVQEVYAVSFDGSKKKIFDRELSQTQLKEHAQQNANDSNGFAQIPETTAGTTDDEKLCRSTEGGIDLRCTECFQLYGVDGCSYR